jgi:[ribosomal protein S18]-alanine N-acetyltransferase
MRGQTPPSPLPGRRPERLIKPMIFGLRRSPPPVIRLLRPDRAQACARLHAEWFAHPWSVEEMAALISNPSAVGAAALDPVSGRLRGFVLSRLAADEAEILTIAVDAAHQGRGVGRALLSENLRQVANAGAKAMFLEVAKDNAPALALYERFGFVKVGERPGYYRRPDGTRATAVVMRKALG